MSDTTIDTPKVPAEPGVDLSRALTFFFEDPEWLPKLLVGTLFAFLTPFLIGAVFVSGYAVMVAKRTMDSESLPLPEWDDLSGILMEGVKGLAISLAHKLPVIVLTILMLLALLGGALLQREASTFPEAFFYYGVPALFFGLFLVFVFSLAVIFYVPAAFVRFIQTDRVAAAFDVAENIAWIRKNTSAYLSAILVIALAGVVGQFGIIVFCVGVFPAMFWSACVMGYVVGVLARLDGGAQSS